MNQPSDFQLANPLSPKKFWKKVIGKMAGSMFTIIVLGLYVIVAPELRSFIGGTMLMLIVVFSLMMVGIYALYVHVYIKRYYYNCDDQFITIKKGVFAPVEIHVQYQKIQDVYVDQDILDRIMGLYDVHIASATAISGIEAHIDGVDEAVAERIKNCLLGKLKNDHSIPTSTSATEAVPSMAPVSLSSDPKISSNNYPISKTWIVADALKFLFIVVAPLTMMLTAMAPVYLLFALMDNNGFRELFVWGLLIYAGIACVVLLAIFFVARLTWVLLWLHNYYFEFLADYIVIKTGVIARQETHLPYKSIQDVRVVQGIIDRLFGLATVAIENAASPTVIGSGRYRTFRPAGISLIGQPLERANAIAATLNTITRTQNSRSMGL